MTRRSLPTVAPHGHIVQSDGNSGRNGVIALFRWLGRPFYRPFVHFVRERPIYLNVSGEKLRLFPRFKNFVVQYDEFSRMDAEMRRAYTDAIRPGDTVLDVGAFVGVYTVLAGFKSGPNGHVYAFEPTPATRRLLEKHITLNRVKKQVTVIPSAIGDICGQCVFYVDQTLEEVNSMNALTREALTHLGDNGFQPRPIEVPITRLDAFISSNGITPNVIKIDVEGAEYRVLLGMGHWLASVPNIFVEMHPYAWASFGHHEQDLFELVEHHGRHFLSLDGTLL